MKTPVRSEHDATSLYDRDFCEWTQTAARGLREGRLSDADLEHLAEEIADMGKRDQREVRSRMTMLVAHLMKWAVQPGKRKGSTWQATIVEQRQQIHDLLQDSPSLIRVLAKDMDRIKYRALERAHLETGVAQREILDKCSTHEGELWCSPKYMALMLKEDWYPL